MLIFLTRSIAQDTEPAMSQIQTADYFEQVTEYPENLLKVPLKHADYTSAKSRNPSAFGPKSERIDQNRVAIGQVGTGPNLAKIPPKKIKGPGMVPGP